MHLHGRDSDGALQAKIAAANEQVDKPSCNPLKGHSPRGRRRLVHRGRLPVLWTVGRTFMFKH